MTRACEAPAGEMGGPRCGKPAKFTTLFGDRCETCIDKFREMAKNPHTLINILADHAPTDDEIEKMIHPIE